MEPGWVCDVCDAYNTLDAIACVACGAALRAEPVAPAQPETVPCPACTAPVPVGQRFCGRCGHRADQPTAAGPPRAQTMYFGSMQQPNQARLVLIKGEGMDGVAYQLNSSEHIAGRSEGAILFPDDPLLSPCHANFYYRESDLVVRDESSRNGVFMRIRNPVPLGPGDHFLVGEQLLRLDASDEDTPLAPDAEGTYFHGSPRRPTRFRVTQMLRGGERGIVYRAKSERITLGREGCDLNFGDDPFISGHHARVDHEQGRFTLTDTGSKNGTFVRINQDTVLSHGDYVFLGQQLLRVEIL